MAAVLAATQPLITAVDMAVAAAAAAGGGLTGQVDSGVARAWSMFARKLRSAVRFRLPDPQVRSMGG